MRVGHGFDVHRFTSGDYVVIGGVRVSYTPLLLRKYYI